MPRHDAAEEAPLRTHRGAVTREQMVRADARIVVSRGVVGTSIEHVLTASNASRSRLHRYFVNKEAVIEAVVDFQVTSVLDCQQSLLARVDSVSGLREWADAEAHGALAAAGRLSTRPPLTRTGPDECRVWPSRRAGHHPESRASGTAAATTTGTSENQHDDRCGKDGNERDNGRRLRRHRHGCRPGGEDRR